jgi:hypothetical protein
MIGGELNVEFEYRYRDFGNFKRYNSVVFGNLSDMPINEIDQALLQIMGEEQTFAALQCKVPEMFFTEFPYDPDLDWPMHEFCGVCVTDLPINDLHGRDIEDLIRQMREAVKPS